MKPGQLSTAVALFIFNRPDLTKVVFEQIRRARPLRLYVIADGSRGNYPGDVEKCCAARRITDMIDWPCQVFRNYAEENLGCGLRVSTGVSWVLEQEEEAIFLEDDCLPHPSFFYFCSSLLEKYRDKLEIMHISGNNCAIRDGKSSDSYYFSLIPHCWGWATWRRAWRHYDFYLKRLPETLATKELEILWTDRKIVRYWEDLFKGLYRAEKKYTWDYQWTFACLIHGGLSVTPRETLVSNIGFAADATHTNKSNDPLAALPLQEIAFPLQHPKELVRSQFADHQMHKEVFRINTVSHCLRMLKSLFLRMM